MTPRSRWERRLVAWAIAFTLAPSAVADTADHDAYVAALGRERTVRTALTSAADRVVYLRDVRAVVAEYQAIVRRFPASSYGDEALWHAGRLALDSYERYGEARDRDAGTRLLQRLTAEYPASKLVRLVPAALAALPRETAVSKPAAAAVAAQPTSGLSTIPLSTIKGITRAVLPDVVRITVQLDAEVPFRDERVADPDRLLIDLARTRTPPGAAEQTVRFSGDSDVVRQVRLAVAQNRSTRLALDAAGVATYSIYPLYSPYRLVIDCVRAPRNVPPRPLASRPLLTAWGRRLPSTDPLETALIRDARLSAPSGVSDRTPDRAASVTAASAAPTDTGTTRGFSMARQLGLGISRIVIDPGHGGHDPGAKGDGITEAELVLDVALRLERMLLKVQGVEVVLTRRTDEFVGLQERTAIANREGADLFLSIHANASENDQARGIETYFLNFANNLSAAAVAARENAASGQAMAALPDFVKAIALNNKLDESRQFATDVQQLMIERLRPANKSVRDLGVKQAPFVVLIGAAMPSVLAEVSFITNPQEAKLLQGPAYRQRIADALYSAIRKYQSSLRSVGSVASK
jgi:N-acetylmuramoyl-L-alanine amidase